MPSWKKVIVSGSDAALGTLIITGSAVIGSGSFGPSENTLTLGARDTSNEGGQLGLNAPGGTYTSASFIDNWQNQVRILKGNNTTSTGEVSRWNLHNGQMGLAAYTSPSSFSGTVAGLLAFDSSGNIITTSPGGSGTVTSVSASGTVSGITLGGGTITTSGTLTLSGTISGLTTSNLSATAAITNAQLANSSVTVGSTAISLGGSATTIAGLSSVTSTSFVGALTGNATTATQTTNTVGAGSDADIVYSNMAGNDQFRIRTGGASNAGYVEIATADDGTEPIHVRQYTGVFTSLARTATLLDGSGNTTFPGTVTANGTLLTGNTGTVTSVTGTGTVNGISLSGTFSTSGTLTLGGTLSGIGNSQLTNSAITIAGTSTALGSSISQATILAGSGVFSGSAQIPNSSIANAQLANSSITVGSTAISLGSSATTIAGLSSVTSTTFVGALTGNASTATNLSTNNTNWSTNGTITAVVGQLAWKNYNNNHTIFDASAGTAPDGSSINATNSQYAWQSSYPTLMGWNTTNTYGVRVDSSRVADTAAQWTTGRTITIGSTGKTVDGSGNVSWTLGEIGAYSNTNPSGYTTNTGTVTSVATAGSVNGITLTGGTITSTGTITLGGTLSGIGNAQLTNSSVTIGSTAISLGGTSTTLAGLTNVNSTNFTGSLFGTASNAVTAVIGQTVMVTDTNGFNTNYYPLFAGGTSANNGVLADSSGFTYNPSTNTLTATNFVGTASNVTVTDQSLSGASWYPTFTNQYPGGSILGAGPMVYTPSSNFLQTTVTAANTVQTIQSATNASFFLTFVPDNNASFGAYEQLNTDAGLAYNPSTNILTTTAASASAVLAGDFAAGTYSIPWMSQKTSGLATYFEGDTIFQYETATGRVNATTFNGALTGNATTATTAASASTILANNFAAGTYSIPWMSQTTAGAATRLNGGTSLTYITSTGQLNNTGSIHIQQTGNQVGYGIRLRQQGTANYWDIFNSGSTGFQIGLNFRYNGGANGGYLTTGDNVATIDFTGQHRSLSNTINITGSADLTGLIVIADGTYTNLNNNHLPQINEALPNVSLSSIERDKRVFGVISDKEDVNGERTYAVGSWVSTFEKPNVNDTRLIINSLGEGGMWVCNANGSLENGDYITTSNLPGYGMKQADDVLHNYTVAKITEDCLFDSMRTIDFDFSGSAYKKQFVGVTYHCG